MIIRSNIGFRGLSGGGGSGGNGLSAYELAVQDGYVGTVTEWLASLHGPTSISWGEVTDKPADFAPSAHTHQIADVERLQAALDEKFSPNNPQPGIVVRTLPTDAEAEAFAQANPDAIVYSTEGA